MHRPNMQSGDTIVAISSSASGACARMIVRGSGPDVAHIASQIIPDDALPESSHASRRNLRFRNGISVPAWIYRFESPRSVTGEDVVEFHLPGNALLARMLLDDLIARGARQADAGEFTARAYFNGKLDLSEAEGVAATVGALSQAELDAARRLMSGELARLLNPVMDPIVETLALVEVGIDFSDEDVTFLARDEVVARIDAARRSIQDLIDRSPRLERLAHEPQIVLVGRPNAGKSTLLNALAGHERAVVSDVAGTTRDAIWAHVKLRRGIVRVIDVAGIGSGAGEIESKMFDTARRAIDEADAVLLVVSLADAHAPLALERDPDLVVHTKLDLAPGAGAECRVSALTGAGMDALRDRLDHLAFGADAPSGALALNARHLRALSDARDALDRANDAIDRGAELLALELRDALDALGTVLGQVTPDDVLGRVFAAFCIGK